MITFFEGLVVIINPIPENFIGNASPFSSSCKKKLAVIARIESLKKFGIVFGSFIFRFI
jgi:hypothetical protein